MDCEKVRDRFSSLWEMELAPPEEKMVREHLSSCRECQKEFEQFEKTIRWLRSVGEVEVPNGFLPELQKKMGERKGKAILAEKARGRWLGFPVSLKLPVQAVAMVAIVFLVLYLAKMMPTEVYRLKDSKQTAPPLSAEKKSEQAWAPREMEREGRALETAPETPRPGDAEQAKIPVPISPPLSAERRSEEVLAQKRVESERRALEVTAETSREKDVEQAKTSVPGEEKLKEAYVPRAKAEAKKAETPSPGTGVVGYQKLDSKEAAGAQAPSPEPRRIEKGLIAKEKSTVAAKPPQEIILRISDREEVISKLHELVKQFGGEMVTSEGNMFLASLPTRSLAEFEKELAGLSTSTKADKAVAKKQAMGSVRAAPGGKGKEADEESKEPAKSAIDQYSRTVVRILLIPE